MLSPCKKPLMRALFPGKIFFLRARTQAHNAHTRIRTTHPHIAPAQHTRMMCPHITPAQHTPAIYARDTCARERAGAMGTRGTRMASNINYAALYTMLAATGTSGVLGARRGKLRIGASFSLFMRLCIIFMKMQTSTEQIMVQLFYFVKRLNLNNSVMPQLSRIKHSVS